MADAKGRRRNFRACESKICRSSGARSQIVKWWRVWIRNRQRRQGEEGRDNARDFHLEERVRFEDRWGVGERKDSWGDWIERGSNAGSCPFIRIRVGEGRGFFEAQQKRKW